MMEVDMKGLVTVSKTLLVSTIIAFLVTTLTGCGGGKWGGAANGSAFFPGVLYGLITN
jgi:hypothetical protein